jgi:hypothetical protein
MLYDDTSLDASEHQDGKFPHHPPELLEGKRRDHPLISPACYTYG